LGDNAGLTSPGIPLNTIRRNPPKPAPSRISGTLKLRAREADEAAPPVADEGSAPSRAPAAPRAEKPAPKDRPAREPGRGERREARGEREPGRSERTPRAAPQRDRADAPRRDRADAPQRNRADTPKRNRADTPKRNRADAPRTTPERRRSDAPRPAAPSADRVPPAPRASAPADAPPPEGIRLSKIMAERGICSRREADEFIERGWVFVDGKRVSELGVRIDPDARITLAAEATRTQQQRVTILLHKPVGYVSGQPEPGYAPAVSLIGGDNQFDRDTAQRFHPSQLKNLAPAGRLDIDSTGLLVLTQDGRIARQLIGADSEVDKEYLVRVEGTLAENGLALLNHGLWLDDRPLRPAKVEWINDDQLRFVLREGRKRQIRRMCELVGLQVVGLKRVRIGQVKLSDLPLGQWRYLREDERF
jgi:23S rRNA pseudouridine2604 synthase